LFNDFIDIYSDNNTKQVAYKVDPTLFGYNRFILVLKHTVITELFFFRCKYGTLAAWKTSQYEIKVLTDFNSQHLNSLAFIVPLFRNSIHFA